eukprot:scaffold25768_cov50-Attheya_sp.AAC.1
MLLLENSRKGQLIRLKGIVSLCMVIGLPWAPTTDPAQVFPHKPLDRACRRRGRSVEAASAVSSSSLLAYASSCACAVNTAVCPSGSRRSSCGKSALSSSAEFTCAPGFTCDTASRNAKNKSRCSSSEALAADASSSS